MEVILKLLVKIQEDVNETKNSIQNSEVKLLNKINEKFDYIQSKLQDIEDTVSLQEQRLDLLEKQARERNIVIFGVEEREQKYEDLNDKILEIFNKHMKIDCNMVEIQSVRRIGKKGEKVRPVVVTLSTLKRKLEILRNKKILEQLNYYVKEDYPRKILQKRKELQEKAKEEREKGKKVLIKYDKLIVLPDKVAYENTNRESKHSLSETPPGNHNVTTKKIKKLTQKQKKSTLTSYWNKEKYQPSESTTLN